MNTWAIQVGLGGLLKKNIKMVGSRVGFEWWEIWEGLNEGVKCN